MNEYRIQVILDKEKEILERYRIKEQEKFHRKQKEAKIYNDMYFASLGCSDLTLKNYAEKVLKETKFLTKLNLKYKDLINIKKTKLNFFMVYCWIRKNECLYIGLSSRGLNRLINHEIFKYIESLKQGDTIKVYTYKTYKEIEMIEKYSIMLIRPKFNKLYKDRLISFSHINEIDEATMVMV